MLYISRRVDKTTWGVVDTDDDVETIVDGNEISRLVNSQCVTIHGVRPTVASSVSIEVYQPAETLTRLQVKTRTLQQVDIKVYKNMITSIRFNKDKIQNSPRIRLSDFGTELAGYVLSENKYCGHYKKLVLVFDDKLTYKPNTFKRLQFGTPLVGVHGMGLVYDLKELSDFHARQVYDMLMAESQSGAFTSICDNQERVIQMRQYYYANVWGIH